MRHVTLHTGDTVEVSPGVRLTLLSLGSTRVTLGVTAPRSVPVVRSELHPPLSEPDALPTGALPGRPWALMWHRPGHGWQTLAYFPSAVDAAEALRRLRRRDADANLLVVVKTAEPAAEAVP